MSKSRKITFGLLVAIICVTLALCNVIAFGSGSANVGAESALPSAALAHADEAASLAHTNAFGESDSHMNGTAIGSLTELTDGVYYLTEDIDRSLTVSGNVTLCLNGYKLNGAADQAAITVASGKFTLVDCCGNGEVNGSEYGIYVLDGSLNMTAGKVTSGGYGVYFDRDASIRRARKAVATIAAGDGMSESVMNGGTIQGVNSLATNNYHGGGVYVPEYSRWRMEGGTIQNCTTNKDGVLTGDGGGVYVDGGECIMNGGTIQGNNAVHGGGVYVNAGVFILNEGANILNNNTSASDSGSIHVHSGEFSMSGGTIANGQVAVYVDGDGKFTMSSGNISSDTTVLQVVSGQFVLIDGTIKSNTQSTGYGALVQGGSFRVEGGTISGKQTGVYVDGGLFEMKNGSITGNTTTGSGGGVYVNDGSALISGGSIRDNSAANGSAVYVNGGSFTMGGSATISGNTTTSTGSGDVHVQNGSALVQGGSISGSKTLVSIAGGALTLAGGSLSGGAVGVRVQGGTFGVSGVANISGNTESNVYLSNGSPITVVGSLKSSSKKAHIGVTLADDYSADVFTADYTKYTSDIPSTYFFADNGACVYLKGNEATLGGHDWGEWKLDSAGDADTPISQARSCVICGEKETRELELVGLVVSADTIYTVNDDHLTNVHVTANFKTANGEVYSRTLEEGEEGVGYIITYNFDNGEFFTVADNKKSILISYKVGGRTATGSVVVTVNGTEDGIDEENSGGEDNILYSREDWHEGQQAKPESWNITLKSGNSYTFKYYRDSACTDEYIPAIFDETTPARTYFVLLVSEGSDDYMSFSTVVGSFTVTAHEISEIVSQQAPTCTAEGHITYKCKVEGCNTETTVTLDKLPHTISAVKDSKQPTCEQSGYVVYICAICGADDIIEDIPALGHNLNRSDFKAATCQEDGYEVLKCSRCDHTENVTLSKVDHNWVLVSEDVVSCIDPVVSHYKCAFGCGETKDEVTAGKGHQWVAAPDTKTVPTCTTPGRGHAICSICGAEDFLDEIPMLPHTMPETGVVTKNPTCTSFGTLSYYCTVCGTLISEEDILAYGHDYVVKSTIEATCSSAGTIRYVCVYCEQEKTELVEMLAHQWDITYISQEATCDDDGELTRVCVNCGAEQQETIPARGHSWVQNGDPTTPPTCTDAGRGSVICERCGLTDEDGEIPALGHDYVGKMTLAPNCTDVGTMTYTCSRCNDSYTENIDALGHAWDNGTVTKISTCTEYGEIKFKCLNCSDSYTEPLELIDHDWQLISEKEGDCFTAGVKAYKCSICELTKEEVTQPSHKWSVVSVSKPATCTKTGIGTLRCDACGIVLAEGQIPATGHNYQIKKGAGQPATCLKAGTVVWECVNDCDHLGTWTYTEDVPALDHELVLTDIKAADCITPGQKTYTCSRCGEYSEKEIIPAHGHSMDEGFVKENATCAQPGLITYTCAYGCGYSYDHVIPVRGHVLGEGEIVTEANCVTEGKIVYKCVYCGEEIKTETIPATGEHRWVADPDNVTKYPTCTQEGFGSAKCAICGAVIEGDVIPKLPHEYDSIVTVQPTCAHSGTIKYTCKNCGHTYTEELAQLEHVWDVSDVTKAPSCTAYGEVTYTCAHCGETKSEYVDPLGHSFGDLEIINAGSCEQSGLAKRTCSRCGYYEEEEIEALGHNWIENVKGTVTKSPTCTEVGFGSVICTLCEATMDGVEIPALGHELVEQEIRKQPSCTLKGEVVYKCIRCSHTEVGYIDETGHMWDEGAVTIQPTCTETGLITYTCTRCSTDEAPVTKTEKMAALGHVWDEGVVTLDPTCTEKGVRTYTCTRCSTDEVPVERTEEIAALGHNWVYDGKNVSVKPTCTQPGRGTIVCSHCQATQADGVIPALGHKWNDGVVTTPATCVNDGKIVHTCSVCGVTEEEVISATGHDWNDGVVTTQATCEKVGTKTYTCLNCNDTFDEEIAATGHDWDDGDVTISATCVKAGVKTYTCATCYDTRVEEIAVLGHDWVSVDGTVQPKCTESVTTSVKCSRCEATKEQGVLPATGHKWDAIDEQGSFDATCVKIGQVTYKCSVCGVLGETVIIPALGHEWVIDTENSFDATCVAVGQIAFKCAHGDCDATKTAEIAALGHDWNQGEITKLVTDTKDGEITYTCKHCGATKTEIIYATGVPTEDEDEPVADNGKFIWILVLLAIMLVVECGVLVSQLVSASSDDSNDENDESDGADTSTTVRGNA